MSELQPDMANPFVRRINDEYFVGREAELNRFEINLGGLKNRQPVHEYVAGLEGGGKTYYLHKISKIARSREFISAVVTLDTNVTPYQQIKAILEVLIDELETQWSAAHPGEPQRRELRTD